MSDQPSLPGSRCSSSPSAFSYGGEFSKKFSSSFISCVATFKSKFPANVKSPSKRAAPVTATEWEAVLVCEEGGRRSVEGEEEVDSD